VALVVYWLARGVTDDLTDAFGLPVHFTEVIRADRWLFGGTTPTEQLQGAWCGEPCLKDGDARWWDVAFNTVYASHFYVAMTLGVVLWVRSRSAWRDWMRRYVTILFVGLAGYMLYPTAPPWLASKEGLLGPVARITSRGWSQLGLERQNMVMHGMGNQVAAMPSLHTGIAALVSFWAVSRLNSPWRWLLLLYPVAMGVALCYFGEHYVVDEIAGVAVAGAVMVAWSAIDRRSIRGQSQPEVVS
jgi:membrane-associated phospholipid phosphatase